MVQLVSSNKIIIKILLKQLDSITQSVIGTSQNRKLSDDLTLISIGK